ncbi:N-terminal EF-hand calcium-binding protein 1 isoform X2 [Salmo trutta]|uniref:N-terminal EF-hand calcium-binding protein 1 isoform X2 n=1 Tax=Salmo trutta TaxID=8032 RepID=UPI00113128F9|nr:N-terminal EF-hand calcium-binding protein 1-like isoform X2 [Salmo trutta]
MLACTDMITMCLQSAKNKHLRAQQEQLQLLHSPVNGLPILKDIFCRADKNDDGKLSFDEFNAYFADGILTTEELQELFYSIDGRQNNNLDTDKLSDYFAQHLGGYVNVLSALEILNVAILKAMDKTKKEYQDSSVLGQFVTRFMLRETSSQLLSLQMSLQCAIEAVEEQSRPAPVLRAVVPFGASTLPSRRTVPVIHSVSFGDSVLRAAVPFGASTLPSRRTVPVIHSLGPADRRAVKVAEHPSAQRNSRRCGRKFQKNMCLSPIHPYSGILTTGVTMEIDDHWCSQINRLQQLLDKLEWQNILLVQTQMSATEDLEEFQKLLKSYVDATSNHSDNLHVSIQKLPGKSCYIMYEFWQDRISWMSYLQSNASKKFQRCVIDTLEDSELVSTMLLPGKLKGVCPCVFVFDSLPTYIYSITCVFLQMFSHYCSPKDPKHTQ